jgi:hypothetical protein
MSYPLSTNRLAFALAIVFFATSSVLEPSYGSGLLDHVHNFKPEPITAAHDAERPLIFVAGETKRPEPDIDMFAFMSGKCTTVKVAGRDFKCRAVVFFHSEQGRANFTIALDDPTDDSHIISFSGENAKREQDNLYELTVDEMLLNSKDRPKVDGLPVPFAQASAGVCKQVGNFAIGLVSSISCTATDKNGKGYELQFESDGLPITIRKIRHRPLTAEKRRTGRIVQLECRNKANVAKVLPRDLTAYIIRCLAEEQKPESDEQQ